MDKLNTSYNPDILNCLANLSNDEVFTSPQLVNNMLDLLPNELWSNPDAKFLDPSCKTGVFLREIVRRLNKGLEDVIPDLQERINHILTNQVYGIGITELTSLMSRRTIYCSKIANGKYSVCDNFTSEDGNIYFSRIEHEWEGATCKICGATKSQYDRDIELENHAYAFIHKKIEEIFDMKFDVIIGNPPYQLKDGGGKDENSSIPLYNKFVMQAKNMNPKYIVMIIPARWYSGGRNLDAFRDEMLKDKRIKEIHDFPNEKDCFPDVTIKGGVCYFLWDKKHNGDCTVFNYKDNNLINVMKRPLLEKSVEKFIRYNDAMSILQKVESFNEPTMDSLVSTQRPFGIRSNFTEYSEYKSKNSDIILYKSDKSGKCRKRKVFVNKKYITKNLDYVDKVKVLISKAGSAGSGYPNSIISKPIIAEKGSVCTETYLIIDTLDSTEEAKNLISYISTNFFRFMMSLVTSTQNMSQASYSLVPIQDWNESWTDEKLYKKYGLNNQEIEFIESMIKPINGMED